MNTFNTAILLTCLLLTTSCSQRFSVSNFNEESLRLVEVGDSVVQVREKIGTTGCTPIEGDKSALKPVITNLGFDDSVMEEGKNYLYWSCMAFHAKTGFWSTQTKSRTVRGGVLFHQGEVIKTYYFANEYK